MLTGSNHQFINFHEFCNQFYFIFVTAVMNMREAWLLIFFTGSNHQFWKYKFQIITNFIVFLTVVMNIREAWLVIYPVHGIQNLILKLRILNFHEFFNQFYLYLLPLWWIWHDAFLITRSNHQFRNYESWIFTIFLSNLFNFFATVHYYLQSRFKKDFGSGQKVS